MLAVLIGNLSIVLGFLILSLPVFIIELSRPRDSAWGALIMILGLILITSNERFNGSPMLAVLLSSLLMSRLLLEVSQQRWQQLSDEEKSNLKKFNRWKNSFIQTFSLFGKLSSLIVEVFKLFKPKSNPSSVGKKWIRPEPKDEKQSLGLKQTQSLEANISEKDLSSDQTLNPTSGNNPSDIS